MARRFLSHEAAQRALELADKSYRPKEIRELKDQIEKETHVAELKCSATGTIDPDAVQKIVGMKLELDNLYADWAEGKID